MNGSTAAAARRPDEASKVGALVSGTALWVRHLPLRVRERGFWAIQLAIAAIAGLHISAEMFLTSAPFLSLHHTPVILYILPIAYASIRYGWEGGLCTSGWVVVLVTPNMVVWHRLDWMWLGELVRLMVVIAVGLVLAYRVDREARLRRLAEDASVRLRELIRQTTKVQEEERARIARELHDDTLQSLVLIARELRDLSGTASSGITRTRVGRMADLAVRSAESLRVFSRDLRPSVLDDLGLCAAIEWLIDDLRRRTGVRASCRLLGERRRLDPPVELALFRIAQEALRNVEKHAQATAMEIILGFEGKQVTLSVKDNGVGFTLPPGGVDLVRSGKLGLAGIRERAALVGGSLDVQSRPGQGAVITAVIPAQ